MTSLKNKKLSVRFRRKRSLSCPHCHASKAVICWGFQTNKRQRYYCKACSKTFNEYTNTAIAGLHTPASQVIQAVQAVCESLGQRAAARVFKHKRREVVNWFVRSAIQAQRFIERHLKNVQKPFLEFDELYTFAVCKAFRVYVWTATDAVSKVLLAVHTSIERTTEEAKRVFQTVGQRVVDPVGASSDGLQEYATLMHARYPEVPYAQIIKTYENHRLVSVEKKQVSKHTVADVEFVMSKLGLGAELNTSAIERLNATLRCFLACLNRKTLKFSKHTGHLDALLSLFQAYYTFCLRHEELKTTPAVAAGVCSRPLSLRQVLVARL